VMVRPRCAFTLVELLVVIALIATLAGLLLPALSADKGQAKRTACMNNLGQLSLGLRMYCDDSEDTLPGTRGDSITAYSYFSFRSLVQSYVGLRANPSPQDKLFACPADTFCYDFSNTAPSLPVLVHASQYEQSNSVYSSYFFNAGISNTWSIYTNIIGVGGRKLSSINGPARIVLMAEIPALFPYSWHEPGKSSAYGSVMFDHGALVFQDARNIVSFVDGHQSYIKIYFNPSTVKPGTWVAAYQYEPPPGYEYRWGDD
jgi:prepilin-type N-terminal cleavage/methylation domain-containing protein